MTRATLRIVVAVVVLAIVLVAATPLLVLIDLAGGGDGFGLCPDGLSSCRVSYAAGPELAAVLTLLLFGLIALLRMVLVAAQRSSQRVEGPAGPGPVRSAGGASRP